MLLKKTGLTAYDAFTKKFLAAYRRADDTAAPAEEVAEVVAGAVVFFGGKKIVFVLKMQR